LSDIELVSTAELARRLGYSQSNVLKLERGGHIPHGITVVGWGRRVWRSEDIPAIQESLRLRREVMAKSRQPRNQGAPNAQR